MVKKRAKPQVTSAKSAKPNALSVSRADAVDEQLARYRSMRNFGVTAEPSGEPRAQKRSVKGLPFCVQKHAASHLHYDFRLGWNGVLKSWAIAKGPSYSTTDKRLAVQVEDHPIEYGGFEGIIPKGQYGGGTVMLWDQGTWEPQASYPDVDKGLLEGSLKFILHGEKLKGKWALIRMGSKWAKEKKPNWLLIKEHDEFERGSEDRPITEAEENSVITGRTMNEISMNQDHVWNSKDTAESGQAWFRQKMNENVSRPTRNTAAKNDFENYLKGLPKEHQPQFVAPQLAQIALVPPSEYGWLHELKLDGYRIQARKSGNQVKMLTRKGLDWTARMRSVAKEIEALPVESITIDGELVVLRPDGTTSFADLQTSMQDSTQHDLTYFCFDLLHLNGYDTRELPLRKRKDVLEKIVRGDSSSAIRYSDHLETGGADLLRKACELHAEGILSKNADSLYKSGRSSNWLKMKCLHEQEFVIGGYTLPSNNIRGVGSLLLGYYRDGKLIYAGRTGTGFSQKSHKVVRDRLKTLANNRCPFASLSSDAKKDARWVKPEVVVQVRFATWTTDGLVRQAAFLGIREDKSAQEVIREEVGPTPKRSKMGPAEIGANTASNTSRIKVDSTHAPVRLTHANKILDAESGLTKQMLADYYWSIAPWIMAHVANRPLSLVRCPDGVGHACFFQKHVNAMLPKSIGSINISDKKGNVEPYITVYNSETLASLAQLGVLELHPWGSRNDDLEHPDRLIFDLDPDESLPWSAVTDAAVDLRGQLKKLDLKSFVKTTGGKGLHIVVPIEPDLEWTTAKEFARDVVIKMERLNPALYLTKMTKAARKGKIYLDYLRNERGATSIAPYSPRARVGAAVSMPISWSELSANSRPIFRVAEFAEWRTRLSKDPWKDIAKTKQRIPTTAQRQNI